MPWRRLHLVLLAIVAALSCWNDLASARPSVLDVPLALATGSSPCRTQEAPSKTSATQHNFSPGASEYGFGARLPARSRQPNLHECCTNTPTVAGEDGAGRGQQNYWNKNGLLDSVILPDNREVLFTYDSFARRVLKRVTGPANRLGQRVLLKETRFFWDGQRMVHEITRNLAVLTPDGPQPIVTYESMAGDATFDEALGGASLSDDAGGTTSHDNDAALQPRLLPAEIRTYCHEDGSFALLAGKLPDGTWAHYVNDAIGTPEALVGDDGQPLGELERRAWRMKESLGLTPFRFPGQYEDEETGLCYNRYRYYDPETGRFVSSDPVGLAGGTNEFNYAPSAVGWRDPLGLTLECKNPRATTATIGYHATHPDAAQSILDGGFRTGTKPGRLGSGGVYVNDSPAGAAAEFAHHNPGVTPVILMVQYDPGTNAAAAVPPRTYVSSHPLSVDSVSAPSVRAPGTVNTNVLNGSVKPMGVVK